MLDSTAQADAILCHCVQVTYSEVQTAIDLYGCSTVKEVARQTGAGTGCTCCHRCIREMLVARHAQHAHEMQAVA